jgi:hypothetical protein
MLMQYIGFNGKKGTASVELYEGDVCLCDGKKGVIEWFTEGAQFIFKYLDGSGNWDIMYGDGTGSPYELLGNIYENPELA